MLDKYNSNDCFIKLHALLLSSFLPVKEVIDMVTYIVEVVEDGKTVLGPLPIRLSSSGPSEGPGVTTFADSLSPPILPGQ